MAWLRWFNLYILDTLFLISHCFEPLFNSRYIVGVIYYNPPFSYTPTVFWVVIFERMVNLVAAQKPLMHWLMKMAGVVPRTVQIEAGTVMNIWVPRETLKQRPVVVLVHGFAGEGIVTWQFQVYYYWEILQNTPSVP